MGYYTNYYLEIHKLHGDSPLTPGECQKINRGFIRLFERVQDENELIDDQRGWGTFYKEMFDDIDLPNFINSYYLNEEQKWYEHDDDMIHLSEENPDFVFILYGEGEERDDNWMACYHDGKMEVSHAKITYESNYMMQTLLGIY